MAGFSCTYGRSKVALCPPAVSYESVNFFSRYPLKTTKLWNLKNLLTSMSWFAYLITIISVIISLKLSCYVGRKLGLNIVTEEIALVPFRCRSSKVNIFFFHFNNIGYQLLNIVNQQKISSSQEDFHQI